MQSAYNRANNSLAVTGSTYRTVPGNVNFINDVTVSGNLSVLGNVTSYSVQQFDIYDSLLYIANNNFTSDIVDIGIIGHYNDGLMLIQVFLEIQL
jgi:hypothetical protein